MDNEIKEYCKYCRFYGVLGCKSTLICNDGNRFFNPNIANEEQGMTLVYDDESGTWGEAPEIYASIAFDTQEAFEKAVNILNNYKWISVDEALPIYDGLVLAIDKNSTIRLGIYTDLGWTSQFGNPIVTRITHWQPLPEPPKDGEQK